MIRIGTEVGVSQSIGREDINSARSFAKTGVQLEFIFALIYSIVIFSFASYWVSLFNLPEKEVYDNAVIYLRITSLGYIFYLLNPIFSATLNGTGKTIIPFFISGLGLLLNIGLDPLFIIDLRLGVAGAAIATVIAQIFVFVVFILYFNFNKTLLKDAKYLIK